MRLRNVKNKDIVLDNSDSFIVNPGCYYGKWNKLFNNSNPIYIEIGMGKGKFIIENALKNPNINYIGIEKFDSVLVRALEKINKKLDNLYIVRLNAKDIDKVFNHEIDKIYLNFSDPWPKKRHSDRRLTSKVFLEKYDLIFKNHKSINVRTDNGSLFSYSIESLSNYGYILNDVTFDLHNRDVIDLITTEYEERFVKLNKNIYEMKAYKE